MTTLTNPETVTNASDTSSRRSLARIAGWVITGYVTVFLAFDSITHLVREQHVVDFNDKIGAPVGSRSSAAPCWLFAWWPSTCRAPACSARSC